MVTTKEQHEKENRQKISIRKAQSENLFCVDFFMTLDLVGKPHTHKIYKKLVFKRAVKQYRIYYFLPVRLVNDCFVIAFVQGAFKWVLRHPPNRRRSCSRQRPLVPTTKRANQRFR